MRTEHKTIGVHKSTRNKLLDMMDEKSPMKAVRKLIELSEPPKQKSNKSDSDVTNIRVDLETHKKLDEYRQHPSETNTVLLERLMRELSD